MNYQKNILRKFYALYPTIGKCWFTKVNTRDILYAS